MKKIQQIGRSLYSAKKMILDKYNFKDDLSVEVLEMSKDDRSLYENLYASINDLNEISIQISNLAEI